MQARAAAVVICVDWFLADFSRNRVSPWSKCCAETGSAPSILPNETDMASYSFELNGKLQSLDCPGEMPLLWALRDLLGLTGSKYGCGIGICGLCTVHLDGTAMRSCVLPVSACAGKSVRTIEGLSADGSHPLQQAWQALNVPQCGYCQPGQLMHAASLLAENPNPSAEQIAEHMDSVLCRCGTYPRIKQAVALAAAQMQGDQS